MKNRRKSRVTPIPVCPRLRSFLGHGLSEPKPEQAPGEPGQTPGKQIVGCTAARTWVKQQVDC